MHANDNNKNHKYCEGDGLFGGVCGGSGCAIRGAGEVGAAGASMDESMQHVCQILQPNR